MPVQDPKTTLVAKRLLRIPRIATLVAGVLAVVVLYATFHDTYAASSTNPTLSNSRQASILADIANFASDFCVQLPLSGDGKSFTLDGEAQAKVHALIRMLVNFDIEGSADFNTSEYFNVLQNDLAPQLIDVRSCKLIIWNDLKHRIPGLQLAQPSPIPQPPRKTGEAVFYLELKNSTLQGYATSVSFSPNDDVIAVVMKIKDKRLVRIYDTTNWKKVTELTIEDGSIFESRFSPDGRFLVLAGSLDGVAVYDRHNAWNRFNVDVHKDHVHDFAFVPEEGNTIVTASNDGRACIVNLEAPRAGASKCFHYVRKNGNNDPLFSVAVSQNGKEIATGSKYGVIYRWNIRDNSMPLWISSSPYNGWITDLEYSQKNDLLVAAVDNEGIFGIPADSQTNNAIFSDSAQDPFIQLNSSGDRVFALMDGLDTEVISYSMSMAARVFSFSEDSSFTLRASGIRVSPGAIFDFEVSTNNRYIALVGHNVLVVELQ